MMRTSALVAPVATLLFAAEATLFAQQHQSDPAPTLPNEEPQESASDLLGDESTLDLDQSLQWRIAFEPYFWIPIEISGDVTIEAHTAALDIKIKDLLDEADVLAASGRVEAWNSDRWGLVFDGLIMGIDGDGFDIDLPGPQPDIEGNLEIRLAIADFAAGYRLIDTPIGDDDPSRRLVLDLFGGLRYQYLDLEIDRAAGSALGGDTDWVELMVGGRLGVKLLDDLDLAVRGDVSGFGIGSGSELTWNAAVGLQYHFNDLTSLIIGYRVMGIDYSRGSGNREFALDITMHGPWIGVAFHF